MMREKINIAIIGNGFVGKAVGFGFDLPSVNQIIIDPKLGTSIDLLKGIDLYATFVCVPTPMSDNGEMDGSIVKSVIEYLEQNTNGLIILKSTVLPNLIDEYSKNDRFVYNPEFLRERSYESDFINPEFHVFGGSKRNCDTLRILYDNYSRVSVKDVAVFNVTAKEASLIKYGINSFLASKVLWFNQFFDIVEKSDSNFEKIRNVIGYDKRINDSHTYVPGHDDKRGYGGACFPKDTIALLRYAENVDVEFSVLREVIRKNQEYMSDYELDSREKEQHVKFNHDI